MLPRKRKIPRSLFGSVLSKNKSFRSDNMMLVVGKTHETEPTRFSFVVSKKTVKKAGARNLLKRRGYGALREVIKDTKNGFSCVLFFKKDARSVPYHDLRNEIQSVLKKAGVL